jgi:hypothetical protein
MGWKQFYWLHSVQRNRSERFRCFFAMGKIRGTLCMRSHISVHRATTKYFCNSFVFKSNNEKEGLPRDRTPDLETSAQRLFGKLAHLPLSREQTLGPFFIAGQPIAVGGNDS